MKPLFEAVNKPGNYSFLVRKFTEKSFSAPYHFHPELELTSILKGRGKRYVGSRMHDYNEGDLVLLGSNLPHCWKTEEEATTNSISAVVHFHKDFLGEDFFYNPEMKEILQLLNNSNYGIQFTGDHSIVKENILRLLYEKKSFKRVMIFLDILHELGSTANYSILDKQSSFSELSFNEKQRIHTVIAYIVENFQNTISLNEAASKANMTLQAFCKYFKKITRKTFVETVNDYRVDFAIRQLIHTDKPVSEICFDSGFNDISNFHKTFKRRIHLSPLNYRKGFTKSMVNPN